MRARWSSLVFHAITTSIALRIGTQQTVRRLCLLILTARYRFRDRVTTENGEYCVQIQINRGAAARLTTPLHGVRSIVPYGRAFFAGFPIALSVVFGGIVPIVLPAVLTPVSAPVPIATGPVAVAVTVFIARRATRRATAAPGRARPRPLPRPVKVPGLVGLRRGGLRVVMRLRELLGPVRRGLVLAKAVRGELGGIGRGHRRREAGVRRHIRPAGLLRAVHRCLLCDCLEG